MKFLPTCGPKCIYLIRKLLTIMQLLIKLHVCTFIGIYFVVRTLISLHCGKYGIDLP